MVKANAAATANSSGKIATPVYGYPSVNKPWLEEDAITEPKNCQPMWVRWKTARRMAQHLDTDDSASEGRGERETVREGIEVRDGAVRERN